MQVQSIKSQVYEGILKDILDGIYQPNAIINEKTLIEKYGVSKTPVREALVQLCSEGILNNIPRYGYQLSLITPAEIVETIEFRKVIETGALERCFDRLKDKELDVLRELNREAGEIMLLSDVKVHWEMNKRFHRTLCSFSKNRYLQKSLEDSLKTCTRIANQYFLKTWEEKESEPDNHIMLVKAIENKNLELAGKILSRDIELMKIQI